MDKVLDHSNPIPLHEQLKVILRDEILKGVYEDKIPSERELMDRFEISRSTVRQAVLALVNEGVLQKIHGRGTFISLKPVEEWLGSLTPYNQIVKDMGMKPSIKLLNQGITSTPKDAATTLGLDEFYFIERLRLADELPISIERKYYPLEIGKELANYDLNNAAIYDLLRKSIGINFWETEEVITSGMPTKEEAELLQIPEYQCILIHERFISDTNGNPVNYEHSIFRSDKFAFRINLSRKNAL